MSSASPERALYNTLPIVIASPPALMVVSAIARPPPGALDTTWSIVLMTA